MCSRDRQFKFDPLGVILAQKFFQNFPFFARLLSKHALANHKSNDITLIN